MVNIDLNSSRTIHEQLVSKLSNLILTGAIPSGNKLPSVRSLASDLLVNPHTINKAYAELEKQNLIYCENKLGYFVCELNDSLKNDKINEAMEQLKKEFKLIVALGVKKERILETLQNMEV